MGTLRLVARPFLPRTVRGRMTMLYGTLFLVSGAAALVIAGGVQVGSSSVAMSPANGNVRAQGTSPGLAAANQRISQLQQQLAQAEAPRGAPDNLEHRVLMASLVALVVMGLLSIVLGWLVAGRALRPLRQITATARRISEDNLHERLAFAGPDDELKQLADTIDELLSRLESAFAAQRRFVANASHELRTPLTTMRASLDVAMAKPEPVPAQTAALADRLRAELDRTDALLEGFLALARAQHVTLPDSGVVAFGDVVSAALGAQAAAAAGRGLTVRSDIAPGLHVAGSATLLGRLAGNLIGNAVLHNEAGGWISVVARADGEVATLVVENGGALLDAAQVGELGQPFRRLGADRTGSDTGTGLGLSIVAAIAAAHGGSLTLLARPAGGMRAEVSLPLAPQPAVALAGAR